MLDTTAFLWRHLIPELARTHRVLAPDLPRHGASRPWAATLDRDLMERVVDDMLDAFAVPRAVLLAPGGLGSRRRGQFWMWWFGRSVSLQRHTVARLARSPRTVRRFLSGMLSAGPATYDFEQLVVLATAEAVAKNANGELLFDDRQRDAYGPFAMHPDLLPRVPDLAVPSLWVRGREDRVIRAREVRHAALVADAQYLEIPDAGHLMPLDQPELTADLVRRFVSIA